VETVFGEVLTARTVVLAVGLALGASTTMGGQEMPGGRYGETPATGLKAALDAAGVSFERIEEAVGDRYGGNSRLVTDAFATADSPHSDPQHSDPQHAELHPDAQHCEPGPGDHRWVTSGLIPIRRLLEQQGNAAPPSVQGEPQGLPAALPATWAALGSAESAGSWPSIYPPAPYWTEELHPARVLFGAGSETASAGGDDVDPPTRAPRHGSPEQQADARGPARAVDSALRDEVMLVPDGIETREFYRTPRLERDWPAGGTGPASRLDYRVHAFVMSELDDGGRVPQFGDRVWAIGRTAGAEEYLESLRTGVDCAERLLKLLDADTAGGRGDTANGQRDRGCP
jgi:hypothetical protein